MLIVPDYMVALIRLHRTQHAKLPDLELKAAFLAEADEEFKAIRPHLPEVLSSILDIGCGSAVVSLLIYRAIGGCELHLVDGDGDEPHMARIGFHQTMRPFSSIERVTKFLITNGVKPEHIHWHPVGTQEPVRADFAMSLLSWGWHYPISTYFEFVRRSLRPAGRLVVDVRHMTDGMEVLCRVFKPVEALGENAKGARWAFENPWEGLVSRYEQLKWMVAEVKPETIIEVGTWNGGRAIALATEALQHRKNVHYTGFDLFEDATPQTDAEESNVKAHHSVEAVRAKLQAFADKNPGFTFELVKGNTRQTLAGTQRKADFCFIDGGHSVETIMLDYAALKGCGFIVMDDYYEPDAFGRCLDVSRFGCNALSATVSLHLMPVCDPVTGGGLVRLAVVGKESDVFDMKPPAEGAVA